MVSVFHYTLLFSFLLLTSLCTRLITEVTKNKGYERVGYWFSILVLMFLSAFRAESVGNDTHEYLRIFREIAEISDSGSRYEIGYVWLNKIISFISNNPQSIIIVTSVIIFYSYGHFMWKYSKSPWLSLFIFFAFNGFAFALSGIRQSMALVILLYSYDYFQKKKYIKSLICILFATTFHITAILFIIIFLWRRIKINMRTICFAIIGGIFCYYLFSIILQYIYVLFPTYELYYDGGKYFGDTRLASVINLMIILIIFCFCYIALFDKYYKERIDNSEIINNNYMLLLFLVALIINIIALKLNLLDRAALYFSIFSIILLPNALHVLPKEKRIFYTPIIILLLYVYYVIILIYRPEWNSIYPYSFC